MTSAPRAGARHRRMVAGVGLAVSATLLVSCAGTEASRPRSPDSNTLSSPPPVVDAGPGRARPARPPHGPGRHDKRPNIFMITVDDAAPGDFAYMPNVQHLIADKGVTLKNSIASTPICVPARATLLTGQYAHNHGAYTISGPHGGFTSFDDQDTLPTWLQAAGYNTMFVGKYLNGYGEGNDPTYIPPGWDQWRATVDPSTYDFMAPEINDNGYLATHHRYSTYVLRDQINGLISSSAGSGRPWYLWANYVAPHVGGPREPGDPTGRFDTTRPAPQDEGRFHELPLPHTPDMFRWGAGGRTLFDRREQGYLREDYQRRIESLQAVDRSVASHVAELRRTHQWRNTIVIVASDNGYAVGQHGIVGKLWFFRDISTVPTVIRGPGIPVHRTVDTVISNEDIAATIAAAAGAHPVSRVLDGSDIRPVLRGPERRRVVPLEGWDVKDGDVKLYTGLRYGSRWTYYRYTDGRREGLYDHQRDPYEMHDLVGSRNPAVHRLLIRLRTLDRRYATCSGSGCPN